MVCSSQIFVSQWLAGRLWYKRYSILAKMLLLFVYENLYNMLCTCICSEPWLICRHATSRVWSLAGRGTRSATKEESGNSVYRENRSTSNLLTSVESKTSTWYFRSGSSATIPSCIWRRRKHWWSQQAGRTVIPKNSTFRFVWLLVDNLWEVINCVCLMHSDC